MIQITATHPDHGTVPSQVMCDFKGFNIEEIDATFALAYHLLVTAYSQGCNISYDAAQIEIMRLATTSEKFFKEALPNIQSTAGLTRKLKEAGLDDDDISKLTKKAISQLISESEKLYRKAHDEEDEED